MLSIGAALLNERFIKPNWSTVRHRVEDIHQDLALHIIERARLYHPERGAPSTFTYMLFKQWQSRAAERHAALRNERPFDHTMIDGPEERVQPLAATLVVAPLIGESNELGARAEELIEMLPEHIRPSAEYHLAMGTSLSATAEHLGVTQRTVERHVAKARVIWREHFGLAA